MEGCMQATVKVSECSDPINWTDIKQRINLMFNIREYILMFSIKFVNCRIEEYMDVSIVQENLRPLIRELKNVKVQFEIIEEMLVERTITPLVAAMAKEIGEYSDRLFDDLRRKKYNNHLESNTCPVSESTCKPGTEVSIREVVLKKNQGCLDVFNSATIFLQDYPGKYQGFLQSAENKKLRLAFQRAINLPINTLTVGSAEELMEKYEKLKLVFETKAPIGIDKHSEGVIFCKNVFAKAVLQQGEKLISSKPEMAFSLAAVIMALCSDFPDLIELLLGYFRTSCPYICPAILDQPSHGTQEDYKKLLGYKINDGVIEKQGHYLSRISGIVKLYAAIIVAKSRCGENKPHPHGLENAWRLLNAILECQPTPEHVDALTTVIHDILQVCGPSMLDVNPVEFKSLFNKISTNYFSMLQECGAEGPIGRLRILLEAFSTEGSFPELKGQLPINFW